MEKTRVAIFGAGKIGQAVYTILDDLCRSDSSPNIAYSNVDTFVIDADSGSLEKLLPGNHVQLDLATLFEDEIAGILIESATTHVINALPFFMNEKVARAALIAKCHYIDFTEDDVMADRVQDLYIGSGLSCVVKCGLAPGFINYIGHSLVKEIQVPDTLMISVGALPRLVSYSETRPEDAYNLTWSVDGLVNEYIRPCRIRKDGKQISVPGLNNIHTVILDGTVYEAAMTSGGIGSLVEELTNVPNVHYMTLRYPGHYRFVRSIVQETLGNFDRIKKIFLDKFSSTDDDVIVVYAQATGLLNGIKFNKSYSNKFYGVNGLTAIQSTTAGSGVAILEMLLTGKLVGTVSHTDVALSDFTDTTAYKKYYKPA